MTYSRKQDSTANIIFLSSLFFFFFWQFLQYQFWTSIGITFTIFVAIEFIGSLGQTLELPKILVLLSAFQWIIGPWIDYITPDNDLLYYMYVPEGLYMSFVVPSLISLYIGISIFSTPVSLNDLSARARLFSKSFPQFPFVLIGVGFGILIFDSYIPPSLFFIYFLIENLKFIGLIYLIYSDNQHKWLIFSIVMITALSAAIAQGGIFGDILLWMVLILTFLIRQFKISLFYTILLVIVGAFFIITIQSIKSKLREKEFLTYQGNKTILFAKLSLDEWTTGKVFMPSRGNDLNVRLNQGWIISKVMEHVPTYEPFANGETIISGLKASLLPRFLYPDKEISGGKKNFRRFTGLELNENTSMGISLAGEAWANFGSVGGAIFLFLWGLFIGWLWMKMQDLSSTYFTLMIWSPLIFQEAVKAETEFVSVINFLVKTFLIVILGVYILKKQFKIEI